MEAGTVEVDIFYRFGAALLIGLLVGLQREYAQLQKEQAQAQEEPAFGGTRTFALLWLLGCTAAFLADKAGSVLVFVTIVGIVGGLILIAYIATARRGSLGMTSEAAAVATLLTGAIDFWHELAVAAALGVALTVLLALKLQTRILVHNLKPADVYA